MSKGFILALALLLSGCAGNMALTAGDGRPAGDGVLRMTWIEPHDLEIRLGGKRYVGPWSTERCTFATCGTVYQRANRLHKRHFRTGRATLVAEDGDRLVCEWISHLPEVNGTCRDAAGRGYVLREAPGQND